MLRVHATEHLFPPFRIHGCQFTHQLIVRLPFRILARANADRQKRGDDPNGNVRRGHENNKRAKPITDNRRKVRRGFFE